MRPHRYAIVVTLVASICQVAAQDSESRTTSLEAKVDGYLKPYLETGNFSGSVLIGREGELLLSKGYGLANLEGRVPNGPQTVYHLASVSRIFTSAAVVLLGMDWEGVRVMIKSWGDPL